MAKTLITFGGLPASKLKFKLSSLNKLSTVLCFCLRTLSELVFSTHNLMKYELTAV